MTDAGEAVHDQRRQLEAEVGLLGPDVEQQVARRRPAWWRPVHLDEGVELGRPGPGEQPVPGVRADAGHQRQPGRRDPEPDGAVEAGEIGEQVAHDLLAAASMVTTRKIAAAVSGVSTACGSWSRTGSPGDGAISR